MPPKAYCQGKDTNSKYAIATKPIPTTTYIAFAIVSSISIAYASFGR